MRRAVVVASSDAHQECTSRKHGCTKRYTRCPISKSWLKTFSVMGTAQGAIIQQHSAAKYHKWHLFQVFEASQEDGIVVKNGRVEMVGLLSSIGDGGPKLSNPTTKYGKGWERTKDQVWHGKMIPSIHDVPEIWLVGPWAAADANQTSSRIQPMFPKSCPNERKIEQCYTQRPSVHKLFHRHPGLQHIAAGNILQNTLSALCQQDDRGVCPDDHLHLVNEAQCIAVPVRAPQ